MPYRRLPNTDNARLRAMKKALEMAEKVLPHELAFSASLLPQLNKFCSYFEQMLNQQRQAIAIQSAKSKELAAYSKKAKLYISHFFQVLNFAILRNEISPKAREFFGLKESDSRIPNLLTEKDIVYWGKQIVKGEQERLAKMGGNPITNPTAAVVKVRYEQFIEALHHQKILQKSTKYATNKIAELRPQVDNIILKLWNEVEAHFSSLNDEEKRNACEKYGIVYIWRPYERKNKNNNAIEEYANEQEIFENVQKNRSTEIDKQSSQNELQYATSFSNN